MKIILGVGLLMLISLLIGVEVVYSDSVPPQITNVTVSNITAFSADVSWNTDEPASSRFIYGDCPNLGSCGRSIVDNTAQVAHLARLVDLKPNTTYYFKIIARDASGNRSVARGYEFRTSLAAPNCLAANPRDFNPDDAALQDCLDENSYVVLEYGSPGYLVRNGLVMRRNNSRLTSDPSYKALLLAHPELGRPIISVDNGKDNITIENVILDGNKANRVSKLVSICGDGPRVEGYNIFAAGVNRLKVKSIESRSALCGTSMWVSGNNFEITDNVIKNGGFTSGALQPWADGITVGRCNGGVIRGNIVENNTDVDIVVGGGRGCLVENNIIRQTSTHAFAGLLLYNFPGGGGDHTNSIFRNNVILSTGGDSNGVNNLDFGLVVGAHIWDQSLEVFGGSVIGNTVSGAVVNLAVDGYSRGTVSGNSTSNPRPRFSWFKAGCPSNFSANYTVAHTSEVVLQSGWISKSFHGGGCQTP